MPTRAFAPELISVLPAIPSLLEVVCKATGSRLALVAQIVGNRWMACSVRDEGDSGIAAGDVLPLEATPCFEVRERGETVVIRDVAADPVHACNPVLMNGKFRSYLASPIILANGQFFGTLCALDQRPALLDRPEVIGMFKLLAQVVATQIDNSDVFQAIRADLRSATLRLGASESGRQGAESRLVVSAANLKASTPASM